MAGSADIGIRVFLDDAASQALGAINGSLARMVSTVGSASRAMGGLSSSMAMVGVAVGLAAAFIAFGAAIKYSVDAASAFQQSMFAVAVATHVPLDAAMQYSSVLMNLAASSTYTSAEIADGIVQMGRAGFSIHDIFTQMSQAGAGFVNVGGRMVPVMSSMAQAGIALGIATRSTAVQGFTMLTQAMAAYQAPADQALHFANILQFAFEHQRGTVSELTSALGQVLPVAGQLHVPFREIAAALDVVGPIMKSTSSAGVALRYMLQGLYSPTDNAKSEMVSLGLASVDASGHFHSAFYDARGNAVDFDTAVHILSDRLKGMTQEDRMAALKNLFSTKGGQGADILIGNVQKLDQYLNQLKGSSDNAGGAMSRWQQVMGTFAGAMAGLKSSVTDLAVVIGTQFLPILTDIATRANGFITAIRNMAMANPAATASFLKLGMVMSVVGLIAAIVLLAFTPIGAAFLTIVGIILGVAAAVILLTVGIALLASWFRNLYASSALVRAIIGGLGAMFNEIGADIRGGIASAMAFLRTNMSDLLPTLSQLGAALLPLAIALGVVALVIVGVVIAALRGLVQALILVLTGVAMVVLGIIQIVTGVVQIIMGILTIMWGLITNNNAMVEAGLRQVWAGIVNILKGALNVILGVFIAVFGGIIAFVVGFVQGIISWFQHLAGVLVGHSIIPDMLNAIKNAFISILSGIVGWIGGWVNSIIAFFVNMGARVVSSVVSAFNQARTAVSNAMNSILAVIRSAGASIVSFATAQWNTFKSVVQFGIALAVSFVNSGAASMVARIVALGASIGSTISSAMANFRNLVSSGIAAAVSFISTGAANMAARVVALGASIGSTISTAMANFRNTVSSGMATAAGAVQGGVARIVGIVSSLPGQLYSWGARAMQSFANGLSSALGSVANAVASAAGKVADFLGHLSPAKMGPLANDDKWMPNMMNMFASQIESHAPLLQNAVSKAAAGMAAVPQMTRLGAPTIGVGGGGGIGAGGGGGGTYTVQLVVDGRVLTQVVMNNLGGQLQLNGAGRAFR